MKATFRKQNVYTGLKTALGALLGYSLGRVGAVGGLVLTAFSPKENQPYTLGIWAGGIAGAAQPETGDMKADVIARAKQFGKGALNMTYLDKFAPEAASKVESTLRLNGLSGVGTIQPYFQQGSGMLSGGMRGLGGSVAPSTSGRLARMIAKSRR